MNLQSKTAAQAWPSAREGQGEGIALLAPQALWDGHCLMHNSSCTSGDEGTDVGGAAGHGTPSGLSTRQNLHPLLTFLRHLPAAHQVGFVAHQDDGDVLGLAGAAQLDAQLGGALEAVPVGDRVNNDVSVPYLQAVATALALLTLSPHGEQDVTNPWP